MSSRILTIALLAVIAVCTVYLGIFLLGSARADVTEQDLYSLTPGTISILDRMETEGVQPVEMKLYFSATAGKSLPKFIKDFVTYERYLKSLLREYERLSDGRIEVSTIDPKPDSDEAQDAADYGLDGKPINQHGDLFYFGLVLETQTGNRDRIEFLWPAEQASVEYEISSRLHQLLWPAKQKVAVLSSLEVMGAGDNPYMAQMLQAQGKQPKKKWTTLQLLEQQYELETLPKDVQSIDRDEYELVVVIHPKALAPNALWALDEWIVRGGNSLILVDPYSISDEAPQTGQRDLMAQLQYEPSSSLDPLFSAWGLEMPDQSFAADLDLAVRRATSQRGGAESVVIDLGLDEAHAASTRALDHPALQGLGGLRFLMAGELEVGETELETQTLLSTTSSGSTLQIQPGFGGEDGLFYTDLGNAAKLRDRYAPGSEPIPIAVSLRGRFPSAYPEGASFPSEVAEPPPGWPPGVPPPTPEDAETVEVDAVPDEERGEATVIVIADTDFIADPLAFQQNMLGFLQASNDNHVLMANLVDYLLGAEELMSIRVGRKIDRPFTLFDEIEAAAEKETLEREKQLRADIARFEEELRAKQSELTQRNAALFERTLQEEVDELNETVQARNRELREIRKERRAALEGEERAVRFSVMGWMPALVLLVGIGSAWRRRKLQNEG